SRPGIQLPLRCRASFSDGRLRRGLSPHYDEQRQRGRNMATVRVESRCRLLDAASTRKRRMILRSRLRQIFLAALLAAGALAFAPTADAQEEFDPEHPYRVDDDGTVDWYTFSGYRRYHADCHVCHGPDGLGSSFGP